MSLISAMAIYFIIWWTVLFAVLPFGVRNAHEAGEVVEEGNEAGAPVAPLIIRKFVITTLISAIVFATLAWLVTWGPFSLEEIPFLKNMPKPNG